MNATEVLKANGIVRPADTIRAAAAAGLELAIACALLEQESAGGRNIWGHDPVPTDGAYTKGGPVTATNYAAYRRSLKQERARAQGVGPTQLTWVGYQDAADKAGGCWDWLPNATTGFRALRDLQASHGERGGFRRYNGSGPAAERYADRAVIRAARWRRLLRDVSRETDRPTIRRNDTGPAVGELQAALRVAAAGAPGFGTFGPKTETALIRFQAEHGLTADGVCGPATWRALDAAQ